MFERASKFNQDLTNWTLNMPRYDSKIANSMPPMTGMFRGTAALDQIFCSEDWYRQLSYGAVTGKYTASKLQIICCDNGFYSKLTTAKPQTIECVACGLGTYQPNNIVLPTACASCAPGLAVSKAGPGSVLLKNPNGDAIPFACISCGLGQYQNEGTGVRSSYNCKECKTGLFAGTTGLTLCVECAKGRYVEQEAAVDCVDCGLGTFQNEQGKQCKTNVSYFLLCFSFFLLTHMCVLAIRLFSLFSRQALWNSRCIAMHIVRQRQCFE